MPRRIVVGCMTGTSLDALDAALVAIEGRGLSLRAEWLRTARQPLGALAAPLRALACQEPQTAGTIARLACDFAQLHVRAIKELSGDRTVDLVAVHGQTVFHAPPASWQLLNPTIVAHALQVPVVCDLRAADLAAGGQGAPITPIADYLLFGDAHEPRAVINLGGFCNVTLLPACRNTTASDAGAVLAAIRAADVCACNHLLDGLARRLFDEPYDGDGRHAKAGRVRPELRDGLLATLRQQAACGRSLGTGDEADAWIRRHSDRAVAEDLLRSACDALATVIIETIGAAAASPSIDQPRRYLLAGGGARNPMLVEAIARRASAAVEPTDALGIPADDREAVAMAVLGTLCLDGVPITLPAVTGAPAPAPLAGVWTYPTRGRPPTPVVAEP